MSINRSTTEAIIEYTNELRLPGIRQCFKEEAVDAGHNETTYEQFLYNLLEKEYGLRLINREKSRVRMANFPFKKYLENLSIKDLPVDGFLPLRFRLSLTQNLPNPLINTSSPDSSVLLIISNNISHLIQQIMIKKVLVQVPLGVDYLFV